MKNSDFYLLFASIYTAPHMPADFAGWIIAISIILSVIWSFLPERR